MKSSKTPVRPAISKNPAGRPRSRPVATYGKARPLAGQGPEETPPPGPRQPLTLQTKLLAGLVFLLLGGLVILLAVQPQSRPDRAQLDTSLATALAATGFTPGPTRIPGSDFGVDMVIYGIKDYIPALPDEKVNFVIINKREKSLFVSNCDGVILQRFVGGNINDKQQAESLDNWESIAPAGFPFCGPELGRESRQIPPGARADASFKFDMKATRPYKDKNWETPGAYRLLVQYYLLCPSGSNKIADCQDKHLAYSDFFRIIAPVYVSPEAALTVKTGGSFTPSATPTP